MNDQAAKTFEEVMTVPFEDAATPVSEATANFVFGDVWSRPGLSRRDRRWVTLTCVGAADSLKPIDDHVYAALNSGDMTMDEMLEFVLHFAVYNGWPKASHIEGVIHRQWARIQQERGIQAEPFTAPANDQLGPNDWDERLAAGGEKFAEVNCIPAPPPVTPYIHAGILNFVFGHVWQRPGISRRDRRFITVASVAICDSATPLASHVGSALESGDITPAEMEELVLQFSVYSGFAKGEQLRVTADAALERLGDLVASSKQ
ncbi:carboxymuconolactone decarboxylase family protein [Rhodococcus sp. BP-149]|uniref:carboxymuconolactone decarboxylase family protein n=1 Tax=unclassified Rhodococcus (in: high G+C Gram-positive bacteria) TaxID=192944 RepID=UPI001C9BAEB0|nr:MULTISPECIES: carboxymuconolactone decarboxylase family protein [unclassified Rhodococcus (in: high G+C Gram-positive bacteria)]MBY6687796.1 carboxymuconolactone decarboxylase family protein [Rhodococcus sp. BP-288]MBY6696061.1 carboxymuconolactone decarboxylase family protein [Rhodococcus sp. BP-188]MBY6700658.1 carboxymuconolactone decarboxylase family protein [Rhodococcus sp. BP-285]MBY6705055.1 carboxymuconolactone decarboxylase family protein [Rhodococcus sp. BP-283]MBY6713783.1 carbox